MLPICCSCVAFCCLHDAFCCKAIDPIAATACCARAGRSPPESPFQLRPFAHLFPISFTGDEKLWICIIFLRMGIAAFQPGQREPPSPNQTEHRLWARKSRYTRLMVREMLNRVDHHQNRLTRGSNRLKWMPSRIHHPSRNVRGRRRRCSRYCAVVASVCERDAEAALLGWMEAQRR